MMASPMPALLCFAFTERMPCMFPSATSIQIVPTLGPKVYRYDLLRDALSPRGCLAEQIWVEVLARPCSGNQAFRTRPGWEFVVYPTCGLLGLTIGLSPRLLG